MANNTIPTYSDIEERPIGDVTSGGSVSSGIHPSELIDQERDQEEVDDVTVTEGETKDTILKEKTDHDKAIDNVIFNALEKIKEYFFQTEIEEQRLAEFMYKIITLNAEKIDPVDIKKFPELLENIVDQIIESRGTKADTDTYNDLIDNLFGADIAKAISERLYTENIDEIVVKLLGEDTRKMICNTLRSDNLDELLNKLVDEKLEQDVDPQAKHPNFDDFISKILGKETEEFIRNKLESFINGNDINVSKINDNNDTNNGNTIDVNQID